MSLYIVNLPLIRAIFEIDHLSVEGLTPLLQAHPSIAWILTLVEAQHGPQMDPRHVPVHQSSNVGDLKIIYLSRMVSKGIVYFDQRRSEASRSGRVTTSDQAPDTTVDQRTAFELKLVVLGSDTGSGNNAALMRAD